MEKKNAHKLDPKRINKIFIWIAFVCVFIFTACFGFKGLKDSKTALMWWGISFAITVVVVAITWITLYFVSKKQNETENDKKIKKILKDKKKDDSK